LSVIPLRRDPHFLNHFCYNNPNDPRKLQPKIQTPETGDSDEISKLKAEMMSYKPLIDDAIKRQNLKEAEALFAKAKELKEKLNELRKKKEIKTIEINGQTMNLDQS
jgi:uncharacterized membrane-anchored protein